VVEGGWGKNFRQLEEKRRRGWRRGRRWKGKGERRRDET